MAVRTWKEYTVSHDSSGNQLCGTEVFCTSSDTKPEAGFITGTKLTEVDTGNIYLFNEDAAAGSKWVFQFSLQD